MATTKKRLEEAAMLRVEGLVQRVGFRRFTERAAREWKISGYVENLNDGSVKIFAQGVPKNLQGFVKGIRNAPKPIVVDDIQQQKSSLRAGQKYFQIRTGPLALEIQEGFGAMESQFTNYRGDFADFKEDFKDYRHEFKDFKEDFKDYRSEFRDYRGEFGSFADRTDSNFKSLDMKYGEISAKLTDILTALQTENKEAIQSLNKSVDMLAEALERLTPPSGQQQQNSTS